MNHSNIRAYKINEVIKSRLSPLYATNNPIHYHFDYYELEIVIEGSGKMEFNDEIFTLKKGDIYLMRPSDWHGHTSNGLVFRQIEAKENILPLWIIKKACALTNPVVFHCDDELTKDINFLMILLEKELTNQNRYYEDESLSIIELIYTYFFRLVGVDKTVSDEITASVLFNLKNNNNFIKKITLDDIAKKIGYSKYYISTLFHKNCGKTLQDYIISLRIDYAKKLLIQSKLSISEIIYESGFSTTSNFYSQFIKATRMTPCDFRRKNKKILIKNS